MSNRGRLSSAPNLLEGKHFLIAGKNKMIKIGDDLEDSSVSEVIQFYGGFVYNKETKSVPKGYLKDAHETYILLPDTIKDNTTHVPKNVMKFIRKSQ